MTLAMRRFGRQMRPAILILSLAATWFVASSTPPLSSAGSDPKKPSGTEKGLVKRVDELEKQVNEHRTRLDEAGMNLQTLATAVQAIPKYEIVEKEFAGSAIIGDPTQRNATWKKEVGTHVFSRKVKTIKVALSEVSTKNSAVKPVGIYWFGGHGEIDPGDRKKVNVFVGHHMSDFQYGSIPGEGFMRILLIAEVE
jgi:hypothetical protein